MAAVPGAPAEAAVAAALIKIASKAAQAHETITGEPLDLTRLHELAEVV